MITKEKVKRILEKLPKEFSVDELIDRLLVVEKVNRGIRASEEGNVYTAGEAKAKLDLISWIKQLSDADLLSFLQGLKNSRFEGNGWNDLTAEQKEIVLSGLKDAEAGKLFSSENFWQKLENV